MFLLAAGTESGEGDGFRLLSRKDCGISTGGRLASKHSGGAEPTPDMMDRVGSVNAS